MFDKLNEKDYALLIFTASVPHSLFLVFLSPPHQIHMQITIITNIEITYLGLLTNMGYEKIEFKSTDLLNFYICRELF